MPLTDLEYLKDDGRWAHWPFQPVKKRHQRNFSNPKHFGIVKAGRTSVYLVNVFDLPENLEEVEKIDYESLEKLVEEWAVD